MVERQRIILKPSDKNTLTEQPEPDEHVTLYRQDQVTEFIHVTIIEEKVHSKRHHQGRPQGHEIQHQQRSNPKLEKSSPETSALTYQERLVLSL